MPDNAKGSAHSFETMRLYFTVSETVKDRSLGMPARFQSVRCEYVTQIFFTHSVSPAKVDLVGSPCVLTSSVSVYPMAATAMRQVVSLALSDPSVQQALQREGSATFVAHVLPHDYGMIGMFADVGTHHMTPGNVRLSRFKYLGGWLLPFLDSHVRTDLMGSNGQKYQVVFSRVDGPNGLPVSVRRSFDLTAKMTPVYIADINATTQQVSRTIDPPRRSFWGDVKMPIF